MPLILPQSSMEINRSVWFYVIVRFKGSARTVRRHVHGLEQALYLVGGLSAIAPLRSFEVIEHTPPQGVSYEW